VYWQIRVALAGTDLEFEFLISRQQPRDWLMEFFGFSRFIFDSSFPVLPLRGGVLVPQMVVERSTQFPNVLTEPSDNDRNFVQRSKGDPEHSLAAQYQTVSLWQYLMMEVDPSQSTAPLAACCFMTGFM